MSELAAVAPSSPRSAVAPDASTSARGYRGAAMEGSIARWYSRTRGSESQRAGWRSQAASIAASLPRGADVLEVAPGPGYLAVELARTGRLRVSALEISRTFVEIVAEHAREAGVAVAVREGDASRMPYAGDSFDFVICQAAFKNFSRPQAAIDEFYRVLRPGGQGVIQDMQRNATDREIRTEVAGMGLGRFRSFLTYRTLRSLRSRAYTPAEFATFAARSSFAGCETEVRGIEVEVRLRKSVGPG